MVLGYSALIGSCFWANALALLEHMADTEARRLALDGMGARPFSGPFPENQKKDTGAIVQGSFFETPIWTNGVCRRRLSFCDLGIACGAFQWLPFAGVRESNQTPLGSAFDADFASPSSGDPRVVLHMNPGMNP